MMTTNTVRYAAPRWHGTTLRWQGKSKIRIEIGDLWIELHPPDGSGGHSFFTLYSSSKAGEISGREPELITMKFDSACVDHAREGSGKVNDR